jgi:squalene monooxygenase
VGKKKLQAHFPSHKRSKTKFITPIFTITIINTAITHIMMNNTTLEIQSFSLSISLTLLYFVSLFIYRQLTLKNNNKSSTKRPNIQQPTTTTTSNVNHSYDYDVIIVGAGVVGGALSSTLARQGRSVLVIERDLTEPDRIVGELLQPGGVAKLTELGMEECLEGIDSPKMRGYGVFYNNEKVQLPYPKQPEEQEAPFGRSFHYGRFVMNLRRHAQKQSGLKLVQGTVTKLLEREQNVVNGVSYVDDKNMNHSVTAALTIIVNGAGSSLTKVLNDSKPLVASTFVGLKLENAAHNLPYQYHGNVFLMAGAPVLCYPISSTDVRCLIDFPDKLPNMQDGSMQQYLKENICPHLPEGLHDAFMKQVESGKIRAVPNREMPADVSFKKKGAVLLGDALNARHPLTGGGMTVGLGDCVLLRDLLSEIHDLTDHEAIDQAMKILNVRRKKYASTINILANALYSIFAPGSKPDPMLPYLRKSVFSYFKLGGRCATGPVGLLAGLTESYNVLLTHFFSVAIVGCFYENFPIPTPARIYRAICMIKCATFLIGPLIAEEKCLPWLFPASIFRR